MTSTLENLLIRFYCAPAEACRRSGEDDEAKNFEDLYVTFREMRQSRYSSRPHPLRERESVTSTVDKLRSRFCCAPAETCWRSSEDDCAKKNEDT